MDGVDHDRIDILRAVELTFNENCFSDEQIDLIVDFVNKIGSDHFLSLSDIFSKLFDLNCD